MLRVIAALFAVSMYVTGFTSPAGATGEVCVPQEAYTTEVRTPVPDTYVEHPAVTHEITVVDSAPIWASWSPNDTKGPQNYIPIWPADERGTWQVHDHLPPGHEGPDGVYQKGQGNSPWFYRQTEVTHVETVIDEPAWTETIHHEDIVEIIEHPAVECPPVDPEPTCETNPELCPPVECPNGDFNGAEPGCEAVVDPTCETDPALCPNEPCPDDSCEPVDVCLEVPGIQVETCTPPIKPDTTVKPEHHEPAKVERVPGLPSTGA